MEEKRDFQSDNILQDILSPLQERKQASTYFYRIMGCNDAEKYFREIALFTEKLKVGGNYILLDRGLELTGSSLAIEAVRKLLEQVPLKDYGNGALLNVLEARGYFSLTNDPQIRQKSKDAFGVILNLYLMNEQTANTTMLRNFVTKILLWLVEYGKQVDLKSAYNPKVLYWGSPKAHEVYFLILMSLIGCDVVVLNPSFQDQFTKVDQEDRFSFLIKRGKELEIGPFPTLERLNAQEQQKRQEQQEQQKRQEQQKQQRQETAGREEAARPRKPQDPPPRNPQDLGRMFEPALVVKLKKTETPLTDIFLPLSKRSGYVGGAYPIFPTYFTRFIGAPASPDDWEGEYFNSLYNLNRALTSGPYNLSFLTGVPAVSSAESKLTPSNLLTYSYGDGLEIAERLVQAKVLPETNDRLWNNTVRKAFLESVSLFVEKNKQGNVSMVLNFALKLAAWLKRYLPKLLEGFILGRKNLGAGNFAYEQNPKVLFYGPIKTHEIYLLAALHKIGCDVLFVHSEQEGDKPFESFDPDNSLTQVLFNPHNLALVPFPESERLVRKSTVAYKASKEIEEVIYNEESGLFKPWQFVGYATQPVTLKTTWDELKILWREPAKLRPEFKIQNRKVYVPNLFAKINGVSDDLNAYWRDLKFFSFAPKTKLLPDVPFTKITYTKQDLFRNGYLLNERGFFKEEEVKQSPYYRFGHLKADLQQFLLEKINELLTAEMFLTPQDERFKLTTLMTVLTMDDSLLKMLETFDYPQEIPKVVVYDNEKKNFSESDAIILTYFHLIGLDVLIFTPTNYMTIERQIKPHLLEIHQLPQVKYDLPLPPLSRVLDPPEQRQSLFARFFKLT